jgi:hypothetical protein
MLAVILGSGSATLHRFVNPLRQNISTELVGALLEEVLPQAAISARVSCLNHC